MLDAMTRIFRLSRQLSPVVDRIFRGENR